MQVYKGASSSGNISKEFTMNAAFIDADGIITNIIVVDSIEGHPELDLHPVNPWVGIGMHIDEPEPVTNPVDVPTPTPPKKTSCSSLEFYSKTIFCTASNSTIYHLFRGHKALFMPTGLRYFILGD